MHGLARISEGRVLDIRSHLQLAYAQVRGCIGKMMDRICKTGRLRLGSRLQIYGALVRGRTCMCCFTSAMGQLKRASRLWGVRSLLSLHICKAWAIRVVSVVTHYHTYKGISCSCASHTCDVFVAPATSKIWNRERVSRLANFHPSVGPRPRIEAIVERIFTTTSRVSDSNLVLINFHDFI